MPTIHDLSSQDSQENSSQGAAIPATQPEQVPDAAKDAADNARKSDSRNWLAPMIKAAKPFAYAATVVLGIAVALKSSAGAAFAAKLGFSTAGITFGIGTSPFFAMLAATAVVGMAIRHKMHKNSNIQQAPNNGTSPAGSDADAELEAEEELSSKAANDPAVDAALTAGGKPVTPAAAAAATRKRDSTGPQTRREAGVAKELEEIAPLVDRSRSPSPSLNG